MSACFPAAELPVIWMPEKKGPTMKFRRLALPLIATIALASPAVAAPGDGVAKGCLKAFVDLAKKGRPDRLHAVRRKVCQCVQDRVKDDAKIDDTSKDKVADVLASMVSDAKRSGELQRALSKVVNAQMRKHMGVCNQ